MTPFSPLACHMPRDTACCVSEAVVCETYNLVFDIIKDLVKL